LNRDPVSFLTNDQWYDPAVLGKYGAKIDPSLAFIADKRAGGACDQDLIRVTTANGLFKDQARYLVEKQDLELWASVLTPPEDEQPGDESEQHRRSLIDQVVQTALPETRDPDHVSTSVKAFMAADLPHELIELLERIVLQGSDFSDNKNLQNLLILTAIKADKERVMEYINRLDNFDGPEIAKIAISDQYGMYEEGFVIYTKFAKSAKDKEAAELNVLAMGVLVDDLKAMERASEFAERADDKQVWSRLAKAQLGGGLLAPAIASYLKADDHKDHVEVIAAAEGTDSYEELVPYLVMARTHVKEAQLDTTLIYAYAKANKLGDLEEFISAPNVARIDDVGERCFNEELFMAAKLLFASINNNAKLALCLVNLEQHREAVDAAHKANSVSTWKEVNRVCVRVGEFKLARIAGLQIIVHPDHLEELTSLYERSGATDELIELMEQGLGLDQAHSGIFTELGVLYSKYVPEKLMEHIKIFWSRMNAPKVMKACEKALLWYEAVFLLKEDEQYDSAVKTMISHPSACSHDLFLECAQKVRNAEVYYKAIAFCVEQQPLQLNRLLQVLTPNLDHSRVTHQLRKLENLPLALPYLRDVQKENLTAVNDAVNELCVDDEDYDALRSSINDFDNFDHIALAQKVEKHELLEFRRIAATIYKKHKRWEKSVQLSKADKMYKDAIDTCSASGDAALVEDLLRFFVDVCDKECFCATLYTCYKIVTPDVALELAWRSDYVDFAMPYVIQYARHLHDTIAELEKRTAPKEEPSESEQAQAAAAAMYGDPSMGLQGGPPMLMAAPGGYVDPSQGHVDPSMGYGVAPPMPPQQQMYPGQMPMY
jgi:clathrin heavy chain